MSSNCCNSNCQLAGVWTKSGFKVDKVTYIWTIDDFDFYEAAGGILKSPTFSADTNDDVQWYLVLSPCENNFNIQNDTDDTESDKKDGVPLFVRLSKLSKQKTVFAKFQVSILNEHRKTIYFRDSCRVVMFKLEDPDKRSSYGWSRFHKNIDHFRRKLLSNNKLILSCEITFSKFHDIQITTHHICKASPSLSNSSKSDFSKNFSTLLKNNRFADVVLSVKGTDFPAHKAILTARSPVFAAMFQHDTEENQHNRVQIDDIDAEVVKEMLHFIYTDECEHLNNLAARLLVAADKYDLGKLKMICTEALVKSVTVENVAKTLLLSDMHNAIELKSKMIGFIVEKFTEVQNTADWNRILSNPQLMNDICGALHRR